MNTDFDDTERDRLCNRRSLLRHGALAIPFLLGIRPALGAERAGAVEEVKGEAFAEADTGRRTLDAAGPVFLGDEVLTGDNTRLAMRLGRDTTIRLGEKARLKIDRYLVDAGGEITLKSGPLLFDRPAGAAPAPVQIRSPFALIAVRGTRFFAGPSKGKFGVFVERGSVAVTSAGRRVVLQAGEGTDIAAPGARPTPPAKWKPPRIRAALASVR